MELRNNSSSTDKNILKTIVSWMIHNLKFLFIPGVHLKDVEQRKLQYDLIFPKKRRIHSHNLPLFIFGLCIILFFITLAIFQSWISPYTLFEASVYSGTNINLINYAPPSSEHPLGRTFNGFDVLARIIFGTRAVLIFTLTSTLVACLVGIFIGAISAYYGGWLDALLMRIMDVILSFPGVIFAVILITIWGEDYIILILIYSIIGTPYFARIVRTKVNKEKEMPYITAEKVVGAKDFRIIFRHIIPNCSQTIVIGISYYFARCILSLSVLAFLRFGNFVWVAWDIWIEWGTDIVRALGYIYIAPWAIFYPSLMIVLSILGFLLFGDSLSDNSLMKYEKL